MNLNNAYKIYESLVAIHTPGSKSFLGMGEAIELATAAMLQEGDSMRQRAPDHPKPIRDSSPGMSISEAGSGRKIQTDGKNHNVAYGRVRDESHVQTNIVRLKKKQKTNPWMVHQSAEGPD